ncbi:2-C-methyl-D-erythritol 4-phosphate cytidylyltransferase [Bacteroidales bacterium OttesenSCG-928-B11]|nr:2-C-methyl-D-erythritol 4-phosphate cytidylyltransferase [Bacteroidales bacterium OttesenSCG-928-B11]MDL2326688.1 2-C-methyl-D-erythritol 4-phosphate cytidylyltransferase [Bacteroidales bacterium OttesenSCG-928-A14]
MQNIAILLAAGSGRRFAAELPKQFVKVNGKMLLEYTIDAFEKHPDIDEIRIAVQPEFVPLVESLIQSGHYKKLTHIIIGGKERYDTTRAIISQTDLPDDCNVLLHDAVRPFIAQHTISEVIAALREHEAVVAAVPATDTVLEVGENGCITTIPDRKKLWNAQTPQAFRLHVLRTAFANAHQTANFNATDDGSVVFRYLPSTPVYIVKGEPSNIKITYNEDIRLITDLLTSK